MVHPFVKSKWIKELHIKPETLKLIEEKVGERLEDMGTGEKFLNRTEMACVVRSRFDKWDLIKMQSFQQNLASVCDGVSLWMLIMGWIPAYGNH